MVKYGINNIQVVNVQTIMSILIIHAYLRGLLVQMVKFGIH
jgi:hypothetical protein